MTVNSFQVTPHTGNTHTVWSLMDKPVCRPADAVSSAVVLAVQIRQDSSYRQSVLKCANEKNVQSQKQLDNAVGGRGM